MRGFNFRYYGDNILLDADEGHIVCYGLTTVTPTLCVWMVPGTATEVVVEG